jgi:acetoin utilization deacetylase AcuC-like enzyme
VQCERNYPFTRIPSDLDVELPAGTGDGGYLVALDDALGVAFARAAPELVLYVAGADPWEGDALGRLALTKAGLRARDELVLEHAAAHGVPLAVTLAGGYAPDVRDTVDIHAATIAAVAHANAGSTSRA